jgi:hypothetical protein
MMGRLLWGALLLFAALQVAQAQGVVQQLGPVVAGHPPMWAANGRIMDAGGSTGPGLMPTNSNLPGTRLSGIAIVNSGLGICQFSGYAGSPYSFLCSGFDGHGNGIIALDAVGGGNPVLNFEIAGQLYQFPGNGQGNILGPNTTTINEPMVWANTTGTLAKDGAGVSIAHTGSLLVTGDVDMAPPTAALSSLNARYFPTFTQLAGTRDILDLSSPISDSTGSYIDTLYAESSDSDTTVYGQSHTNSAGRFAAFGPYSSGYVESYKNILGLTSYCYAATSATPTPSAAPGCGAIEGVSAQFGGGIGDNELWAINPSAGGGSVAQSVSLASLQLVIDAEYADVDSSHTAYGLILTNISTKNINALLGTSGAGTASTLIAGENALVSSSAFVMPKSMADGSCGSAVSTIIDYGAGNGNPAGGSFSYWDCSTGNYAWVDSGVAVGTLSSGGMNLYPASGSDGYFATPASGSGGVAFGAVGSWADGLNLASATITDAAIVLNTTALGSAIKWDGNNYMQIVTGQLQTTVGGTLMVSLEPGHLRLTIPTDCAGAVTGDWYSNAGVVTLCP